MSIPRILIAIYDYHAQDDEELSFKEGDIFYELDATNPDWLKVRLRLPPNNEQQEREGLIPGNYVQELTPKMTAKVLYDYNPQEPDETQIVADEVIHVLRDDDPDWILVKSRKGCGMVPRTYIETQDSAAHHQQHSQTMDAPEPGHQPDSSSSSSFFSVVEKKRKNLKSNIGVTEDCFVYSSGDDREPEAKWHLSEVRDCTSNRQILCIEVGGPNPRTFEFTCSSKTEAEQIADKVNDARKNCSHAPAPSHHVKEDKKKDEVDEMKAGGPGRHPLAVALYDFEAQEDDELTIQEGDQLEVTDKDSSPEWWLVRHSSPGRGSKEGLVPSNYIRIVGEASGDQAGGAPIQHASPEDAPTPQPKQPAGAKVSRVKTTDSEDIPLNKLVQNRQQKPGPANVRVWTDKTGTYKVEAEFLSLEPNNQVNLFKTNGAKIFVPLEKLDSADVLYIEQKTGKKLLPAHASAQPLTARQRQEAEAKKHPDRKKVNYDWDWFDFFTLKADINADFALKYATTFVADRLDNESISEITAERMRSLGVRESDIPLIERAFQVHMGTPVLSEVKPSGPGSASGVPHRPPAAVGVPHQQRQETQPGGVKPLNSSLEANLRMRRQIQDDEALARRLQEEEEKRRRRDGSAHARQGPGHKPAPPMNNVGSSAAQPARSAAPGDPFTNFAFPKSDSSRPMSPANRPHAPNRSATSVVDPSQLSSVRDKLAAAAAAANQGPARPGMDYPTTAPAPQDDAWMAKSNLKPVINSKPKRSPVQAAFPQQNTKPLIPTPSSATTIKPTITNANLGTSTAVTSVPVTDMPGISHSPLSLPHNPPQTVAQLTAMNDAANAKAQELRNRELQLQQQREYLEKQAMLLKQQQEQLTQARQTQQVEQQLRQIREQKERLEFEKQRETQKRETETLRRQQEQLLQQQRQLLQWQDTMLKSQPKPSAAPATPVPQLTQVSAFASMPGNNTAMSIQPAPAISGATAAMANRPANSVGRLPAPLIPTQMAASPRLQVSFSGVSATGPQLTMQANSSMPNLMKQFNNMTVTSQTATNIAGTSSMAAPPLSVNAMPGSNAPSANPNFADFSRMNSAISSQPNLAAPGAAAGLDKYDLFKRVDPRGQSLFSSSAHGVRPGMTTSFAATGVQPTGVFAMSNPTLDQASTSNLNSGIPASMSSMGSVSLPMSSNIGNSNVTVMPSQQATVGMLGQGHQQPQGIFGSMAVGSGMQQQGSNMQGSGMMQPNQLQMVPSSMASGLASPSVTTMVGGTGGVNSSMPSTGFLQYQHNLQQQQGVMQPGTNAQFPQAGMGQFPANMPMPMLQPQQQPNVQGMYQQNLGNPNAGNFATQQNMYSQARW